jgi:hypothetical protein
VSQASPRAARSKARRAGDRLVLVADQSVGVPAVGERLVEIDLFDDARALIDSALASGATVAIVVPDLPGGKRRITRAFDPDVPIVAASADPNRTARDALKAVGASKGTVAVAADRVLRAAFVRAGARAVPHPALAGPALNAEPIFFAEIVGPRDVLERLPGLVPYRLDLEDGTWRCLGVVTAGGLEQALKGGLRFAVLPLDPATEDPLIVQLDAGVPDRQAMISSGSWALFALGPEDRADTFAAHGTHGHFTALAPTPGLLKAPRAADWRDAVVRVAAWPGIVERISLHDLVPLVLGCSGTAATFQADVDRYAGGAPLDASGLVASRHSAHPHNARVVQALLADLRAIGYCAWTHAFSHNGQTIHNVIADLPGTGFFKWPEILLELREVLIDWPPPPDPPPWDRIKGLVGDGFLEKDLGALPSSELRRAVLERVGLAPWIPWRLRLCPLQGPGAELVIVGAHLDSTAARDAGYQPATGAARGMDDDASGMATVLAAARELWAQRGRLHHTVRFAFFNAEESGLVGSQAYAAMLNSWSAPVRAVVCTDMSGYNSDADRRFEVHAGATNPAVRDASVPIADRIAAWAASLGSLGPAQIYRGTNSGGGADRNIYDGAIGRSDHASFQQHGYPAVVASEDFFINQSGEPAADSNPNYHRAADTVIDSSYGTGIACAVIRAVEELAS